MYVPVIGIVGGIGSGKSTVARAVAEKRQIVVIDADKIGHQVLTLDSVKAALRERFGNAIFDEHGGIDRPSLGKLVFGREANHEQNRLDLEAIVHPHIRQEIERQVEAARQTQGTVAAILDAAVLLESGWHEVCDDFVFINTPLEQRMRNVGNRGWAKSELERRESHQLTLDRKRHACRFEIDNSTTIEHASQQLIDILDQYQPSPTE